MAIKKLIRNENGITYVEIIVSVVIIGFIIISIMELVSLTLKSVVKYKQDEISVIMASECMDTVRNFRDNTEWSTNGIGTLTVGTGYHPIVTTSGATTSWSMALGTETINSITRHITFSSVSRNPVSRNIESTYNAANNDPETRLVTVTLNKGSDISVFRAYLTNWH